MQKYLTVTVLVYFSATQTHTHITPQGAHMTEVDCGMVLDVSSLRICKKSMMENEARFKDSANGYIASAK